MNVQTFFAPNRESAKKFTEADKEAKIRLELFNPIDIDHQEYDFDKSSYRLLFNSYLNSHGGLKYCLIMLNNKVYDRGLLIQLSFENIQHSHDVDILYPVILAIVKLFKHDSFRHQRSVILQVFNEIYIMFQKSDIERVLYPFWGGINDLENIEDYMIYIYTQLRLTPPKFNEFMV